MFNHLHVHTRYSLLDGHADIKALVKKAKDLGQEAIAITDHGVMYGAIEFYNAAVAAGIKPIIGCELYTAENAYEKFKGETRGHIILLAKDETGYQNLMKMASFAATDGFYYRPRVDTSILRKYHEGVVCLSGCIQGDLQRAMLADDYDAAKRIATEYKDIFGDDYYIELQYHGIPEQKKVLARQLKLSRELGIKTVATNDVHYVEKGSAEAQRVAMCIGMQTSVENQDATGYGTPPEMYLKSEEEMTLLFGRIAPEALANTKTIADKCNLTIKQGHYLLPEFEVPEGKDKKSYFLTLCTAGLIKRYKDDAPKYRERLNYETSTIESMGFIDYFLIVYDIVAYARKNSIVVGCRGSAGGSIVAYCLGISDIDPMRWGLQFERFLNPERVTMPDIDIDVDPEGREALFAYLIEKYGANRVCQIVTVTDEGAKFAIRDTGKALGMDEALIKRVSNFIPKASNMTIAEAIQANEDFRKAVENEPDVYRLINMAQQIEGTKRNCGTHAAAAIISPDDLTNHIPIKRDTITNRLVSQYDMSAAEAVGMLKIDLLGLRNLAVIKTAEAEIQRKDPNFKVANLDFDDPAVYELLSKGDTSGVFQFESDGMRDVLRRMQPSCFDDMIAAIALYRPGPIDNIPTFIENKHQPDKVSYLHPVLKPILEDTYGIPVYQEQVMAIVRDCAGYSLGRSDLVRRAMAKKKASVMEAEKEFFINGKPDDSDGKPTIPGCINNGIPKETAEALWAMMTKFAEYAFNKSHAASYARVAYQTAYLKCHYPLEYRAALLTSEIGKDGNRRLVRLIHDCVAHGIEILPPDINASDAVFMVEGDAIRFGMAAIKDTGKAILTEIVTERSINGPFTDLCNLVERTLNTCNKSTLTALIKSGSLDSFPHNRAQMLAVVDTVLKKARAGRKKMAESRMQYEDSFFAEFDKDFGKFKLDGIAYPDIPERPNTELYAMEMESTGIYITGHPIHAYSEVIKGRTTHSICDLIPDDETGECETPNGTNVRVAGIIVDVIKRMTRNKRPMANVTVEDQTGKINVTVFPRAFESYGARLNMGVPILVYGNFDASGAFGARIEADSIAFLDETAG